MKEKVRVKLVDAEGDEMHYVLIPDRGTPLHFQWVFMSERSKHAYGDGKSETELTAVGLLRAAHVQTVPTMVAYVSDRAANAGKNGFWVKGEVPI